MTDEILKHPFITNPRNSFHWEDRYRLREAGGAYPEFAGVSAPFTASVALIDWNTQLNVVEVRKSGEELHSYPSLQSAYLDIYNGVDSFVYMDNATFRNSREVTLLPSGDLVFTADNSPLHLYREHDDEILISRYIEWLRIASRWAENPSDFYNAHHFIKSHPATWLRREDFPQEWRTSCGIPEISVHLVKGLPLIMLEGAVRGDRSEIYHAHDESISAYCPTYEEAIVSYAANLHAKYDVKGAKR